MSLLQSAASDPRHSVWVAASAGTGKTKVLTDRVLRLMLEGTPVGKILCLTFTKAAAAEMANRIHTRLSDWAIMDETLLAAHLHTLTGARPSKDTITLARQLFVRVLDSAEGLKIQTIHSFCQSLMQRFPLEAGIAPHFTVIEERTASELLEEARLRLLTGLSSHPDSRLQEAVSTIAWHVYEGNLRNLLQEIVNERAALEAMLSYHGSTEQAVQAIYAVLGVNIEDNEEKLLLEACTETAFDREGLLHCCRTLLEGTDTEKKNGEALRLWLAASALHERTVLFPQYMQLYLTKQHEPRKTIATKPTQVKCPEIADILHHEQSRLLAYMEKKRALKTALLTGHLLYVARTLLTEYHALKTARAYLDYNDLILTSNRLLMTPAISQWILYKLDGGIDHILIDEAQDTSPEQWHIIETLCAEFFSGEGQKHTNRTIFVVGDEKQSIFSFQGADPLTFNAMQALFERKSIHAAKRFRSIRLDRSFRSTPAILQAVDTIFAEETLRSAISFSPEKISHTAHRSGSGSYVELWPLICPPPKEEKEEPWSPPITSRAEHNTPKILAELIALTIRGWLDEKHLLSAKGRAITAGDILILVRRRTEFTSHLVTALKKQDIPVAGIDRMVMTDNLAVMDLIALGKFLLLPEDDLNLATVLKTPLLSLSEEALFELAYDRGRHSLWERLALKHREQPYYNSAYQYLSTLLAKVDFCSPFELFSNVLDSGDGRKKLCGRLGLEINDPLDEFLSLTLQYEQSHVPSLQGFLHWLENGDIEIKRDLEQGKNQVRIMTVHGSKGLQAPIVFMPDTTQTPSSKAQLFWDENLLLWPGKAANMPPQAIKLKERNQEQEMQEYARLLYVALTRAEDRLIICGWQGRRLPAKECWYNAVHAGLSQIAEEIPFLAPEALGYNFSGITPCAWRLSSPDEENTTALPPATLLPAIAAPPAFLFEPAAAEPFPPLPLTPSLVNEEDFAARSPLSSVHHFQRGQLIHKLLQWLPSIPAERYHEAAIAFLTRYGSGVSTAMQEEIIHNVISVLHHPVFAPIFSHPARAEVPVTGIVETKSGQKHIIAGQIDRLVVMEKEVLIIDYKTNCNPPDTVAHIPTAYLKQMASYALLLSGIYTDKTVHCALLWTETPLLMHVPKEMIEQYSV